MSVHTEGESVSQNGGLRDLVRGGPPLARVSVARHSATTRHPWSVCLVTRTTGHTTASLSRPRVGLSVGHDLYDKDPSSSVLSVPQAAAALPSRTVVHGPGTQRRGWTLRFKPVESGCRTVVRQATRPLVTAQRGDSPRLGNARARQAGARTLDADRTKPC